MPEPGTHLHIVGGRRLSGEVAASGSKNAALPMMAAALLTEEPIRLQRVPHLTDVETLWQLLAELGLDLLRDAEDALVLQTVDSRPVEARYELVQRMRASFCVLGPLLAKRGRAVAALPGGCNIGERPVDLHLMGLTALGATVEIRHGFVIAQADRLVGADIQLAGPNGPTVTGTANIMSAATLAQGTTTIHGAAREPEIACLGQMLNSMGARIEGLGTSTLRVTGVPKLHGTTFGVIPDRIEAATLLLAGAITQGDVTVTGVDPTQMEAVVAQLRAAGIQVTTEPDQIRVVADGPPHPMQITARPYPGPPTDLQAQWTALLSLAQGTSEIRDQVFHHRFMHVAELCRFGTEIEMRDTTAIIHGVNRLSGAEVMATDLRAAAALVLAGLAARGESTIHGIEHLDRGYERLDEKLRSLGAEISRQE